MARQLLLVCAVQRTSGVGVASMVETGCCVFLFCLRYKIQQRAATTRDAITIVPTTTTPITTPNRIALSGISVASSVRVCVCVGGTYNKIVV